MAKRPSKLSAVQRGEVKQEPRANRGGVVVAYPHPVGEVGAMFHTSLVNVMVYDAVGMPDQDGKMHGGKGHITRRGGHLPLSSGANIVAGRNKIVKQFLDDFPTKPEWLWFVDADMTFEPNIVDRMLEVADKDKCPILGALCFAMLKGTDQEIVPTVYGLTQGKLPLLRFNGYPIEQLMQVNGTGAACLMVHRTVFEKMRTWKTGQEEFEALGVPVGTLRFPPPWPWFAETVSGTNFGDAISEDLTFCLRAQQAGFPVHVDTRIKTGHVKPVVIDEEAYWKALPPPEEPAPTFVVIPVKGKRGLTTSILDKLVSQGDYERIFVYDNAAGTNDELAIHEYVWPKVDILDAAGLNIHQMWNRGIMRARAEHERCNIAILNNDLELGDEFLERMAKGLRIHPAMLAVCANYDGREFPEMVQAVKGIAAGREDGSGGFGAFAFMVRGELFTTAIPMFDEQYEIWYGDNDFVLNIEKAGGSYGMVRDASVVHIGGGSQTSGDGVHRLGTQELRDAAERDRQRFEKKWAQ